MKETNKDKFICQKTKDKDKNKINSWKDTETGRCLWTKIAQSLRKILENAEWMCEVEAGSTACTTK
jgi:hypothetical protein